jgi:hypothetical protein
MRVKASRGSRPTIPPRRFRPPAFATISWCVAGSYAEWRTDFFLRRTAGIIAGSQHSRARCETSAGASGACHEHMINDPEGERRDSREESPTPLRAL